MEGKEKRSKRLQEEINQYWGDEGMGHRMETTHGQLHAHTTPATRQVYIERFMYYKTG